MGSKITGPEGAMILANLVRVQYRNRNTTYTPVAFFDRLEHGGQDPAICGAACGDSFCTSLYESAGMRPDPNIVFTGDNPGNALITRIYDTRIDKLVKTGTSSTAYFVKHIAAHGKRPKYFLFAEGHTLCGAMDVVLANGYHEEEAGLYEHIAFLHEKLKTTIKKLDEKEITDKVMRNALLAQKNVDVQVEMGMDLYKKLHPGLIESGKLNIIGMMRDITGDIYAPETPMVGDVFITNINGITDVDKIKEYLSNFVFEDIKVSKEAVEHNVRRLKF